MYRVAICEDEAVLRESLAGLCHTLLTGLAPEHEIAAFPSAEALSSALEAGAQYDLLLLDILMEGKSGMELAREVRGRDEHVSILFLTSSDQFLKEGYAVRPIQYLFKPVDLSELAEALETDLRLHHRPRTLTLRSGGKAVALEIPSILYLESRNHSLIVRTDKREQCFRMSLTEAEGLLPAEQFCRCHNSYLVNMARIGQIGRRELTLSDGTQLPVSKRFHDTIHRRFIQFLVRK